MKNKYIEKKEEKIRNWIQKETDENIDKELQKLEKGKYRTNGRLMIIIKKELAPYFTVEKDIKKRYILLKTIKRKNKKEKKIINKNLVIGTIYTPTGKTSEINDFYNKEIELI